MAVVWAITPIAPSHKAADIGCVVGGGDASSESTARERGFAKYSVATLQMGNEAAVGAIAWFSVVLMMDRVRLRPLHS